MWQPSAAFCVKCEFSARASRLVQFRLAMFQIVREEEMAVYSVLKSSGCWSLDVRQSSRDNCIFGGERVWAPCWRTKLNSKGCGLVQVVASLCKAKPLASKNIFHCKAEYWECPVYMSLQIRCLMIVVLVEQEDLTGLASHPFFSSYLKCLVDTSSAVDANQSILHGKDQKDCTKKNGSKYDRYVYSGNKKMVQFTMIGCFST